MSEILNYQPGQIVTFYEEVKDADGQRTDDGYVPVVTRVILPGFTLASGYPLAMTRMDVGLYYFQYAIPQGGASVGTYFVDVAYLDPNTNVIASDSRQIVVTAPYGNYAALPIPLVTGGNSPTGSAGGDLFGFYPNPTVAALQGSAIAATPPTTGQFLEWSGTAWTPTTVPTPPAPPTTLPPSGPAGGDLSGTYPDPLVSTSGGNTIITSVTTIGGDLSGTLPDPTVSGLQDNPISSLTPTDGQVLTWVASDGYWTPVAPASGGSVDATQVTYTPTSAPFWDPPPTQVAQALDQLAARPGLDYLPVNSPGTITLNLGQEISVVLNNTGSPLTVIIPDALDGQVKEVVNGQNTAVSSAIIIQFTNSNGNDTYNLPSGASAKFIWSLFGGGWIVVNYCANVNVGWT